MKRLILALALLASCAKGFGTDFEGMITTHVTSSDGKVPSTDIITRIKGDRTRFDMETGGYVLYDGKTGELRGVEPAQKVYMDLRLDKASPQPNTSGASAAIDKTGKHEKIAGVDCETWIARDPSGKRSEVCIAKGLAFVDITDHPSSMSAELKAQKLYPLRSVEYDASGKELTRSEVTKIERKRVDDADFMVPADYTKMDLKR